MSSCTLPGHAVILMWITIEMLQTEPSYFKQHIRIYKQMEFVERGSSKEAIASAIYAHANYDVELHWFWRDAVIEFENLRIVYCRYRDSVHPGGPLPNKVALALGTVESMLVAAIHKQSLHLQATIEQRPSFRHMYHYGTPVPMSSTNSGWSVLSTIKGEFEGVKGKFLAFRNERLWFILMQMLGSPDEGTRFRYDMLLGLLDEYLAESNRSERERLDPILYSMLSALATLIELLWTIRLHLPFFTTRTFSDCIKTEDRPFWRRQYKSSDMAGSSHNAVEALRKFQNTAPPSGPRNHRWLDQFENLHRTSQTFWRAFALIHQEIHLRNWPTIDFEQEMNFLFAWKDEQYTKRLERKRQDIMFDIEGSKIQESEDIFLPLPIVDDRDIKPSTAQPVTKVKTQGKGWTDPDDGMEELSEQLNSLRNVIIISKTSYKTFRSMFPATREERKQYISWNGFVDSMVNAGFVARNGGGSIVTFHDTRSGGKIIFHRPHPDPTIDPIMLQSMGRRLNKWFGWDRETFASVRN